MSNTDHPIHYNSDPSGIEVIDVIYNSLSNEEIIGFLKGNILKYVLRAEYKSNKLEDIKKAAWYTKKLKEIPEYNMKYTVYLNHRVVSREVLDQIAEDNGLENAKGVFLKDVKTYLEHRGFTVKIICI